MCWKTVRHAEQIERVDSDITFLEKCEAAQVTPSGFDLRWTPQGLDIEAGLKTTKVLVDASMKLMAVCLEGLRRKKSKMDQEEGKAIRSLIEERTEKEAQRCLKIIEEKRHVQRVKSKEVKGKKLKKLTGSIGLVEDHNEVNWFGEEEAASSRECLVQESVPESWEERDIRC